MRQKVIAGNWKMHCTIPEARRLATQLTKRLDKKPAPKTRVIICPPSTALSAVSEVAKGSAVYVGAQNIAWEEEGAFTGEVSVKMIKNAGAKYTIIAHSERRKYFNETSNIINKKIKTALRNKVKVIYCVGETLDERQNNLTKDIVLNQMEWDLKDLEVTDLKNMMIAYEPVWAIGTGKTATPEQAQDVHSFIRDIVDTIFKGSPASKLSILYGGSVKPGNAEDLLSQPDIDGALVGGAALDAAGFHKIIQASEKVGKK